MNVRRALLGCTAALATLTGGIALAQQENVIIVLDASGSMWGQVDGVPKIVIAREVFADLLSDWDTTRNLGVMAYGHRREGDCADIQQIIDVGPVDPNTAINTINSVMPRGRTPLTDAVRLAAEQLRYQDEPATVILLTDGLETCNADPCALATELEAGGVNFTAHVIGFDVAEADRPQLSCIAENTGGMFLPADNAQQLGEAMQTVAVAPPPEPEPVDAEITLSAVDAESRDPVSGVSWRILVSGTEEFVSDSDQDTYTLTLEGGEYIVVADAGEAVGSSTITVEPGVAASHEVPISFPTETASVTAPAEIPAASLFQVTWENPDAADQDYVTIVEAGAPEGTYNDYARVREGNPLEIVAPDALGAFEVRFIDEESRETLGSQAVTLTPISASLDAPAEIAAGSVVRVGWEGPDAPNDYITIVEAGAPEGTYTDYARTRNGSPAEITVPDAIGNYEIRYVVQQSGRTLASLPVTLTAVSASLDAPAEAAAGDTIQVGWEGPDSPNDYITVVEAGAPEGTYTDYARTRNGSPAEITLPDAIGSYEIRYVVQQSGRTLASAPITLTAVGATLDAPAEIPAGSSFQVEWDGPDNHNDYITIVEAGAPEGTYTSYARTRNGSPAEITAPDAIGSYEVRYVVAQSGRTLASQTVTLTAVGATVEAPAEIPAGSQFQVEWEGPDNHNDYITIVEAGAPEGTYTSYARTRNGSPAEITAPDAIGSYEVRYVVAQSGRTLASQPVELTAVMGSLDVPDEIPAGSVFQVAWEGPNNHNDYITIVEAGAPEGTYDNYTRTRNGNPIEVTAPDGLGNYEVRYVIAQSGRTLVSQPVTLTPVTAQLIVNGPVPPGTDFDVQWVGPDNHNDYITIVAPGAPEGTYTDYARTRTGSVVSIEAPAEAGDYEVRYVMAQSGRTVASVPVTVGVEGVSLESAPSVAAGGVVEVTWTGPGRYEDFIEIVPAGSGPEVEAQRGTRASQGSPLQIFAPAQAGQYEIRYRLSDTGEVLATIPLTVE